MQLFVKAPQARRARCRSGHSVSAEEGALPAVREKSDRKRIRQAARNIKKYLNTSKEDDK